jgi:hypothetical protein
MEIHALNSVNGFDHNRPLITEPCRRQGDSGFRLGNELFSYVRGHALGVIDKRHKRLIGRVQRNAGEMGVVHVAELLAA